MPQYKVVEKKTKTFLKGRMTAQQLEKLINEHAGQDWTLDRLVAGDTARIMGFGEKDVFLIVFRKD